MAGSIPSGFEVSLVIALRMIRQSYRTDYAGKLPHQRDAGSEAVAKALIEQLKLQGWTISPAPVVTPLARSRG